MFLTVLLFVVQENGRAVPVLVVVALSGVKVCDPEDQVKLAQFFLCKCFFFTNAQYSHSQFAVYLKHDH